MKILIGKSLSFLLKVLSCLCDRLAKEKIVLSKKGNRILSLNDRLYFVLNVSQPDSNQSARWSFKIPKHIRQKNLSIPSLVESSYSYFKTIQPKSVMEKMLFEDVESYVLERNNRNIFSFDVVKEKIEKKDYIKVRRDLNLEFRKIDLSKIPEDCIIYEDAFFHCFCGICGAEWGENVYRNRKTNDLISIYDNCYRCNGDLVGKILNHMI